jgi:hypothetical protein
MSLEEHAESKSYWDLFARDAASLNAPLYARLAAGVRDDAGLRELASHVQPGQPPANMLFGAVHFLLLRGAQHPLRGFYPNLTKKISSGDPFPAFRDFCFGNRAAITALLKTRVTNTNEVARSALLYPGFAALAREAPQPFHIVEVGPSAGLNLYWDRYGYRYSRNGKAILGGVKDAELVIETPLKGECVPPLDPPPRVGQRIGIERSPVDLANADDRDWLKALVWPDHGQRFRRLELALQVNAPWPHDIRAGDAASLLPDVLAEIPEDQTLCVYHTITLYQFTAEMQRAFEDILILASVRRPLFRLSLERANGDFPLTLTRYEGGTATAKVLAIGGPQGAWLEWR